MGGPLEELDDNGQRSIALPNRMVGGTSEGDASSPENKKMGATERGTGSTKSILPEMLHEGAKPKNIELGASQGGNASTESIPSEMLYDAAMPEGIEIMEPLAPVQNAEGGNDREDSEAGQTTDTVAETNMEENGRGNVIRRKSTGRTSEKGKKRRFGSFYKAAPAITHITDEVYHNPKKTTGRILEALKRRYCVTLLLLLCTALLIHLLLINIPPQTDVQEDDLLLNLAAKAEFKENKGGAHVYSLGGYTVRDEVNWINPRNIGFPSVERSAATLGGSTFEPKLWGPQYVSPTTGQPLKPLPTNEWWQPFVIPPGTDTLHGINQDPYLLSVITKPVGRTDIYGDTVGLAVFAPYTKIEQGGGGTYGYVQSFGPPVIGWKMGVRLTDSGDHVQRHFVESHSALSLTKVWEIHQFGTLSSGGVDITKVFQSTLRAPIVRGSPFVTMELPKGHTLLLETQMRNTNQQLQNRIVLVMDMAASTLDHEHTCDSLNKTSVRTDALIVTLKDTSEWILVLNRKVQMRCQPSEHGDRILSKEALTEPLVARLALLDMCDHPDAIEKSDHLPAVREYCQPKSLRNQSIYRWRLMTLLNSTGERSVESMAEYMNKKGSGRGILEALFLNNPLYDQLVEKAKDRNMGEFEVSKVKWESTAILEALKEGDTHALVIPNEFVPRAYWDESVFPTLGLTDEVIEYMRGDFLWNGGGSMVFVGGTTGAGCGSKLMNILFSMNNIPSYGLLPPNRKPIKLIDLSKTPPFDNDQGVPASLHPNSFPAKLEWPTKPDGSKSQNSIEMVWNSWEGWPFKGYCMPGTTAYSCAGAVYATYYMNEGMVGWVGLDWSRDLINSDSNWVRILMRLIWAGNCWMSKRKGNRCTPLGRVKIIEHPKAQEYEEMFKFLTTEIFDAKGKIDPLRLKEFLRGTNRIKTDNVGSPMSVVTSETETIKDFILRHALTYPKAGFVEIDTESDQASAASLRYRYYVEPLSNYEFHSLFPPFYKTKSDTKPENPSARKRKLSVSPQNDWMGNSDLYHSSPIPQEEMREDAQELPRAQEDESHKEEPTRKGFTPLRILQTTTELLWPADRQAVLMHTVHTHLEYNDTTRHDLMTRAPSLEDDRYSCFVTSHGRVCARSFAKRKMCAPKHRWLHGGRFCESKAKPWEEYPSLHDNLRPYDLNNLEGYWTYPEHNGIPTQLRINFPLAHFDYMYKNEAGIYRSIHDLIPSAFADYLLWSVQQDTKSDVKLDPQTTLLHNADDISKWVRGMHRYAQIALISDNLNLIEEKTVVLKWMKEGLEKILTNQFDNILVYDTTWGGIVPCGCDRKQGKGKCATTPRTGLETGIRVTQKNTSQILSTACPSLRLASSEGGAGFHNGTHLIYGNIVYVAAVIGRFDSKFLNKRVKITTVDGIFQPKIHHIIMALVNNYASPAHTRAVDTTSLGNQLRKYHIASRHKDWWYLHSYSTGVELPDGLGQNQESFSEAAFSYWAISLYGRVVGDKALISWGGVLAGAEIYASNAWIHIKEWSETYPPGVRYLGSVGRLAEFSAVFNTVEGVEPYRIFNKQTIPFTLLSLEVFEPGWILWMAPIWLSACNANFPECLKNYGDIGLVLTLLFEKDWLKDIASPIGPTLSELNHLTTVAADKVAHITCFQQKSYDCGVHTLSNSMYFAALAAALGGAPQVLNHEDGNGRFRIY